ncbi:MAG TPA: DNA/RNA nuclease SfsA [Clostridiales bacterium]|nr:DNA/RNA nuclease SfsA [Clostridiales bacterium]
MDYTNIYKGFFKSRPNRFIANIEINGRVEVCHVKNTGRCRELLIPNAAVFVQKSDNPNRKTAFDLIAVYKDDRLINMDSQIPNKVFNEWVNKSNYFKNVTVIKPEYTLGNSRIDFYIEANKEKILAEIKGVTLEVNGIVRFPDAPTLRGLKHIEELCDAVDNGYTAYVVFIVQMSNVKYFTPNYTTHMEFGQALKKAQAKGVHILALACEVTPSSITAIEEIPVVL